MNAAPVAGEILQIPLDEIHESPLNPRKTFREDALQQLADSMAASGQLESALARPRKDGGYELAAGHRRYRAAKRIGLATLKTEVRPMADPEFIEILNVSNLQRDDLHPLEEAEGFVSLMKGAGYDIPKIAARVGKSTKYVYDRIKLLQLIKPAQALFLAGKFEAGHAILLARLSKEDQARAIGDPSDRHNFSDNRVGGLFIPEHVSDEPGLELEEPRKAASVREFQSWINDHVRFVPEKVDLPNLFPETAAVLAAAQEEELKVIHITRDYRVADEAKDPKERTYGDAMWKRADGQPDTGWDGRKEPGKTCDHAVLGIVVAGPGRGEAFKVCIEKKKCDVHWAKERKEAARAVKNGNGSQSEKTHHLEQQRRHEAEQKKQEIERARWKRAIPELVKAVAEKLPTIAVGLESPIGKALLLRWQRKPGFTPKGTSAEDLVRLMAFHEIAEDLNEWRAPTHAPRVLKLVGLDALAIVDRVVPVERPAALPASKEKGVKVVKTGRTAADVRRERKAKARG